MPLSSTTIEKLAFGGNGVCRIDGKVCFVPYSCPDDVVSLRITSEKKSYCIGSISEIVTPSPFRVAPVCPLFGTCGGCSWQHISYPVQLQQKRTIFAETLWKGARIPADLVGDIVAAPVQYSYRGRLQFKVSVEQGRPVIGFFRQGSHRVIDASGGCPVASPIVNQVVQRCREVVRSYPDVESLAQISIDAGDNGVIVILHHTGKVSSHNRKFLTARSAEFAPCTGLFIKAGNQPHNEKLWGSSDISYFMPASDQAAPPLQLAYPPGGFAQVNQRQNSALLALVRLLGDFSFNENLLDLYCGNGNFSLPLAGDVAAVTGIEGNADSIRAAEQNQKFNTVANARFICDDVVAGVQRLFEQGEQFSAILLDPPRAGAGDAIPGIVRLNPDKIVYISCDPSTLARDCALLADCGYRVVRSVPVDMFPQTYHIESVTLLCR
jgi:23S rRNA (uracil1939-C5)-methyltransferase